MSKTNIKVRIGKCFKESFVMYVIIYTNDRTVHGHHVYCLVSRVNILLQGNVQRVTHTSSMQVLTVVLYHLRGIVSLVLGC